MHVPVMKVLPYFITSVLFVFMACEDNPLQVPTEDVQVPEIKVLRMEEDLFQLKPGTVQQQIISLQQKYGLLFDHFLMNPLRLNGSRDSAAPNELLAFTTDKEVRGAWKEASMLYGDMTPYTEAFKEMRKRFHYHFPTRPLPKQLVTTISGWNYAVAYMDSSLILSLDMYLGDTSVYYQMLRYPQYQTRKMNKANISTDLARGWILTEFEKQKPENTLLHHTIFYGKIFYAIQALLPDVTDSLIIGYSGEQIKTCKKYEKQYWGYFAEKNRLYENSLITVRELTTDGPFTAAISRECPPRIAMWVGWQIVQSYMKKNKVSLEQLMMEKDPQKILAKSKYRP